MTAHLLPWRRIVVAVLLAGAACAAAAQSLSLGRTPARNGDYITVVVNQELVTAGEVDARMQQARMAAARANQRPPADDELRKLALDSLIEERVIVTHARSSGVRVDDGDIDRAVQNIAAQNQLSVEQLRLRLREQGLDYARFRANLRDQILIERVREREVYGRIRVSDEEVERFLAQQKGNAELNIAQILVTVPEGADDATVAQRRALAERALARVRAGEAFDAVAREVSEDGNRQRGGEIGLRPADRLPDVFVEAVRGIGTGELAPTLLRSGAGFHVLKVLERRDGSAARVTQTRARHILLRASPQAGADAVSRRLDEFRQQIVSGQRTFEALAREFSEDASSAAGGDLGWASAGTMVPEFEEAMNRLPVGGVSPPVISRFGVHLIQVIERREVAIEPRQLREQARNVLREQKFGDAYTEWAKELRTLAYVEMREPPQ
jgi:peptidyl-prolyl cis-trans isomerase SurA